MKTLKTLVIAISKDEAGTLKITNMYSLGSTDDSQLQATSTGGAEELTSSDLDNAQALYDSIVSGIKTRNDIQ